MIVITKNILLNLLLVFGTGFTEAFIWTWYMIEVSRKRALKSSLILLLHASIYLFVVSRIIESADTLILILGYAIGAALGNCLRVWRMCENETRTC